MEEFPLASALAAAVIMAVHLFPALVVSGGVPDNLRVRAHQQVITQRSSFSPFEQSITS